VLDVKLHLNDLSVALKSLYRRAAFGPITSERQGKDGEADVI
jgi:hypothetical protein